MPLQRYLETYRLTIHGYRYRFLAFKFRQTVENSSMNHSNSSMMRAAIMMRVRASRRVWHPESEYIDRLGVVVIVLVGKHVRRIPYRLVSSSRHLPKTR